MKTQVTVGWFEIPVTNMERAIAFYEKVFACQLNRQQMQEVDMAWFPWDETQQGAGGTLVKQDEFYAPSQQGVLVYFSSEDVTKELDRVAAAGGMIQIPKTQITPEVGYMAVFTDSEGNRIALHSRN